MDQEWQSSLHSRRGGRPSDATKAECVSCYIKKNLYKFMIILPEERNKGGALKEDLYLKYATVIFTVNSTQCTVGRFD